MTKPEKQPLSKYSDPPGRRSFRVWPVVIIAVIVVGLAIWFFKGQNSKNHPQAYLTAAVERGSIISTVSSTGTVNPTITVKVGSQISGQIKEIHVDFNSEVKAGQVIALIDPEQFETRVKQAEAELALTKANLSMQRAALKRARIEPENIKANLAAYKAQVVKDRTAFKKAENDLTRYRALLESSAISNEKYDEILAVYEQTQAQLEVALAQEKAQGILVDSSLAAVKMAQAQVEQAQAQVLMQEAALRSARLELDRTVIRSPVDGVVISRDVDVGQTVAASLQAPTLFTIAQDLSRMQVEVNIDEADIGKILPRQKIVFTVDAFPDRRFEGQVDQIRKAPQTVQNVVTYTVIASTGNKDDLLLPGMTANVEIIIAEYDKVLKAPNSAFRFLPEPEKGGRQTPAGSRPGAASEAGAGSQNPDASERFSRLLEALELSPDQRERLGQVMAPSLKKLRSLRQNGASPEEMEEAAEEAWRQNQPAILALLAPEQKERYQRILADQAANPLSRGRVYLLGLDGRPQAVSVTYGVSDGSYTQVLGGEIKEGDLVIVGAKRSANKSGSRGLRWGL